MEIVFNKIQIMCSRRKMLPLILLILTIVRIQSIELTGQSIKDALIEYSLLDVMNNNQYQGIEYEEADDGFPSYKFLPTADVKSPYRMLLPEKFNEFAILIKFLPNSPKGGYLFSVVNPFDTIVELGLHLSPVIKNVWNISLLYTQPDSSPVTRKLVSYQLPYKGKEWTTLAFQVLSDKVVFYIDCENKESTPVVREPLELVFDSASTLYLAQAGSHLAGHFEGNLHTLYVYGNPEAIGTTCKPPEKKLDDLDNEILNDIEGSGMVGLVDSDADVPLDDEFWASTDIYDASGLPPPTPPPFTHDRPYRTIKGERGEKGARGPPGDSIRGPPGPPGSPGQPGTIPPFIDFPASPGAKYTGKCTCNASDILEAIKDNEVLRETIRGPPGRAGSEGKTGAPGRTGATGVPGERGAPGLKGDRGDRGDPGPRGPEGLQGHKGEPGVDGLPGVMGSPGPPGAPGLPENYDESLMGNSMGSLRSSSPGPKGSPGEKGDLGQAGERGQPGQKGERGDPGMTGEKGDRGHTGSHGPAGSKGEPGQPGVPGIAGSPGASGLKGDRGLPGEMGSIGPAGPPGQVVFTDTPNGASNSSSSQCQCPAGAPGPPGPRGPQGYEGPPGLNGEPGPAGSNGLTGLPGTKGEKGEKGVRGLSGPKGDRGLEGPPGQAFFAGGYEGMAMNGTKGDKGEKGMRGRRGKPGTAGPIGPPGKPGPIGDIGHSGRPGLQGLKGDLGPKGLKGDSGGREGPKGDKGDHGKDGRDGLPGPPGLPAAAGEGVQYMPGPPGPPGTPGQPGLPGLSISGPKGEPGMDSRSSFYGDAAYYGRPGGRSSLDEIKALRELQDLRDRPDSTSGPPGPPGPPGPSNSHSSRHDDEETPYFSASSWNMRIVPGAVTFPNIDEMTKKSAMNPPGTLAYITEEEALLVRVNKGWQYIALGTLVPIATPAPPTTVAPPVRVDIQSSNLLNNLPPLLNTPTLRVAALNEPFIGDLQGIRGADFACYRQGRRAGLLGTFKAFLSSRVQNLDSIVRVADRDLPVVNTRGDVLFNSWKGIFNGQGGFFSQAPRIYSFSGKNVLTDPLWPQKHVWHGSLPSGERSIETYCDAWHSGARDKFGYASNLLGNKLLDQERQTCDSKLIVLCVEALSQDRRRRRDLRDSELRFHTAEEYERHLNEVLT